MSKRKLPKCCGKQPFYYQWDNNKYHEIACVDVDCRVNVQAKTRAAAERAWIAAVTPKKKRRKHGKKMAAKISRQVRGL